VPNFPKIHNKAEFDNYVTSLKNEVQSGKKWLSRDVTAVKKDHFLLRVIKRVLNLFPGDRFAPIRADKAAHSLLDFCEDSQNRTYVDVKSADQLISLLDFLKDKTKYSKHSKAYVKEIEEDKQKIQALVTTSSSGLRHLFPDKKDVSSKEDEKAISSFIKGNQITFSTDQEKASDKDRALDYFEQHTEEVDTLTLNGTFSPEQEKRLGKLIEGSDKLRKIEIVSTFTNDNKDLMAVIAKKKGIETTHIPEKKEIISKEKKTEQAQKEQRIPAFVKGNEISFPYDNEKNPKVNDQTLDYLENHLEELENLVLETTLTSEQKQRFITLIQRSNKLKKIEIPLQNLHGDKDLIEAVTTKKGLETVHCGGSDHSLANLAKYNPEVKDLALILSGNKITKEGIDDLHKLSHLEEIFLHFPESLFAKDSLEKFFAEGSKLPSLEKLSIQGDSKPLSLLASYTDQFKQLKRLSVAHCDLLKELEALSKVKSNIEEINIEDSYHFSKEIGKVSDKIPRLCNSLANFNLKKLSLKYVHLDFSDYNLIGKLKTIEELELPYPDEGDYKTIEKLIDSLPNLKKISINTALGLRKTQSHGEGIKSTEIGHNSLPPHELQKLKEKFKNRNIEILRDESDQFGKME